MDLRNKTVDEIARMAIGEVERLSRAWEERDKEIEQRLRELEPSAPPPKPDPLKELHVADWSERRNGQCNCDDHPSEHCACRGSCGCHFVNGLPHGVDRGEYVEGAERTLHAAFPGHTTAPIDDPSDPVVPGHERYFDVPEGGTVTLCELPTGLVVVSADELEHLRDTLRHALNFMDATLPKT